MREDTFQTDGDAVDGYSDSENGEVSSPDPGTEFKNEPLSPEERAREEQEIKEEEKEESGS